MIPTMILFGLVFGRWWKLAIAAGALVWTVVILTVADTSVGNGGVLGTAAALGAANAAVGVAAHQAGLWLVRRLRRDRPAVRSQPRST